MVAAHRYLPEHWTWRRLKAQCLQESGKQLDPGAESHAGAKGSCQFMPRTWSEQAGKLGYRDTTPWDARANITAAAFYLGGDLWKWCSRSDLPEFGDIMQRTYATQAGYNTGCGNVNKARRRARSSDWRLYSPFLVDEPRQYVERINCYWLPKLSNEGEPCETF